MSYRVAFETLNEDLIGPYVELSRTEYEGAAVDDPRYMTWKHLENPQGRSLAYHLYEDESLVGRICYQIRDFVFAGQKLRSAYLVDLLIHPDHRSMKTFVQLMGKVRQVPGIDFLYVTPNAKSAPLYPAVLKFTQPYPLSVLACPVRSGAILRNRFGVGSRVISQLTDAFLRAALGLARRLVGRRPSELLLSEQPPPDDAAIDALCQASGLQAQLEGRRDARFHNWRFHASPVTKNRVRYLYQGGDLAGYVVTRNDAYLGYRTFFIIDVYFDSRIRSAELRHLRFRILDEAFREGCDLVLGIFMRENPALARFCAFPLLKVPTRFLPQRVDMYVEKLQESAQLPDDPAHYYITLADLDVF